VVSNALRHPSSLRAKDAAAHLKGRPNRAALLRTGYQDADPIQEPYSILLSQRMPQRASSGPQGRFGSEIGAICAGLEFALCMLKTRSNTLIPTAKAFGRSAGIEILQLATKAAQRPRFVGAAATTGYTSHPFHDACIFAFACLSRRHPGVLSIRSTNIPKTLP
jgi:hypothetical protein